MFLLLGDSASVRGRRPTVEGGAYGQPAFMCGAPTKAKVVAKGEELVDSPGRDAVLKSVDKHRFWNAQRWPLARRRLPTAVNGKIVPAELRPTVGG
ncbi:MAG: hypothetical protein ACR2K2_12115 [Mycobacteriales bacterium]